jgi:diguanylate cyclase (GGDEF)-like protein
MLNSVLIIVAFFSVLFGIMSDLGINDIGAIHAKVDYFYGAFAVLLMIYLRLSKDNYTIASHALLIVSTLTFFSALINVTQDEFRIIWFYLMIFLAYMLNGSKSGILYTAVSVAVILGSHFFLDLQLSQIAINSAVLGLVIGSFLSYFYTKKISDYEKTLQEKNETLELLASTDGLTGIMNKRIFDEVSQHYFETVQRDGIELSLLMLDLDNFKVVNDTYGHQVGDLILIQFAETIKPLLRKSDVFARIGGEEFAVLLFKTEISGAVVLADKIHEAVKKVSVECGENNISVTTSVGISHYKKTDSSVEEIIARADNALYSAKEKGRDQTCTID